MNIEKIDTIKQLFKYEEEWDKLLKYSTIGFSPFMSFTWVSSWLEYYSSEFEPYILSLTLEGDIIAFLPFAVRKGKRRALEMIGKRTSNLLDFIVSATVTRDLMGGFYNRVCSYLARQKNAWDYIYNYAVDEQDSEFRYFWNIAKNIFITHRLSNERIYKISNCSSFEEYLVKKQKKGRPFRREGSKKRRLIKLTNAKFTNDGCVTDVPQLVSTCHDVDLRSWKGNRTDGALWFSEEMLGGFYKHVLPKMVNESLFSLHRIIIDNETVSYSLIIGDKNCWYHFKNGYDNTYRQFSIGTLLTYEVIKRYFSIGIKEMNFMVGDEPYKNRFATTFHNSFQAYIFQRSFRGMLWKQIVILRQYKIYRWFRDKIISIFLT